MTSKRHTTYRRVLSGNRAIAFSMCLLMSGCAVSEARETSVCDEFTTLLSRPPYLMGRELEVIQDDRGKRRVPNVDVDGDGLIDVIYWSCPGQGSPIAADPCSMSIEFSSGRKALEFQEFGFRLVLHRSKLYALAASAGPGRAVGQGKVWSVDRLGVKLVCSKI